MFCRPAPALLGLAVCLLLCTTATAQSLQAESTPPPPPTEPSTATVQDTGSKSSVEFDQTVVNLQTTLPLQRHHSFFELQHRFARDLGRGDFGQVAEDLFG